MSFSCVLRLHCILQAQSEAASLTQQVQHLRQDVYRLRSDLAAERSSKEQHEARVSSLEKQLQEKSSSLVG